LYIGAVTAHDNRVFIGGNDAPALWSSDGSPADWAVVGGGTNYEVKALCSFDSSLYAGGAFSTVADTTSSSRIAQLYDPTVVGANTPAANEFVLHPNYPNPFNPSTTIRYEVPHGGGRVQLQIFDARGRLIRALVSRREPLGPKTTTWNGKDDVGRDVASGVYFLRLEIGDNVTSRKLVLVR
jgi:flagellar hook assembly protein FlgD